MKLRLGQITAGETRHALRFRPGVLARLAEQLAAEDGSVSALLSLRRIDDLIEVQGTLHAELTLPCTRCLAPTALKLDEDFTALQAPAEWQKRLGPEVELGGSDLDLDFFEGDELDLAALVEEQLLLDLPQALYCREDCKGICAGCGRNLNESECICAAEPEDHPFAALKSLLTETKREH
jgi:uncharacterized protein